jgi:hypothetical protein
MQSLGVAVPGSARVSRAGERVLAIAHFYFEFPLFQRTDVQ